MAIAHEGVGQVRVRVARCRHGSIRCALGHHHGSGRQRLRVRYEQCAHSKVQSRRHSRLLKWGRDGSFDGAFFFPRGVAVDFVGNIYVADESNNRIQKFDARGSFLDEVGAGRRADPDSSSRRGASRATRLGNVYVVDSGNHRIQKFDGNGTFLCSFGNRGKTEGQVNFPYGIAVDKEGCVYVVDSGNHRVLKYVPTEEEMNRGKDDRRSQRTDRSAAAPQGPCREGR